MHPDIVYPTAPHPGARRGAVVGSLFPLVVLACLTAAQIDAQGSDATPSRLTTGSGAPVYGTVTAVSARPRIPSDTPRTTAAKIEAAIKEYRAGGPARTVTAGSLVAFPFGHAEPVLTCAVLRACVVELEPGELLASEPIAGDQARWLISEARTGPEGASALVVVKPKDCDLTTNLVISTDRRVYDLDLDSPRCSGGSGGSSTLASSASSASSTNPKQAYIRHVRFYYPDDDSAPSQSVRNAPARADSAVPVAKVLNRDYRVRRARRGPFGIFGHKPIGFPWAPAGIHDDGVRVYLRLPPEASRHAAPVLYALEDDGSRTLVNYAMRDDTLVTDRTFRRGLLVIASGARERRLEFENRAWRHVTATAGRK